MQSTTAIDVRIITKGLITVGLVALTVLLSHRAITTGNVFFGLMIPGLALASALIGRPGVLFATVFFVESARLQIPGFPGALSGTELFMALLIGWMILDAAILKAKRPLSVIPRIDLWMGIFLINLLMIMFVRGFGLRIFGGGEYGGAGYIMLIITVMFYFAARRVRLTDREIKLLLGLYLAGTLLPVGVQLLTYRFGYAATFLNRYIESQVGSILKGVEQVEDGVVRFTVLSGVSYALIAIAYTLCKNPKHRTLLVALAFVFVALTGFRSRIFRVTVLVFMASMYYAKSRMRLFCIWCVAGLLTWAFLIVATPHLPAAVQRTVSIVPLVQVRQDIARRAAGSTDWRIQMWRDYCIPNVPNYLWVGRGAVHDIRGFSWLRQSWYGTAEFYYHMGGYHSGPFSLLLDYGLAGTISFTMFFLLVTIDAWRVTRRYAIKQPDTLVSRYFVYLTILMSFELVNYYLIFGSVMSSLARMLMVAAQLRILRQRLIAEQVDESPADVVELPDSSEASDVWFGSPSALQGLKG